MSNPEVHIHAFAQASNSFYNELVLLWNVLASDTSSREDVEKHRTKTRGAVNEIRAVLDAYEIAHLQPTQSPVKEQLI